MGHFNITVAKINCPLELKQNILKFNLNCKMKRKKCNKKMNKNKNFYHNTKGSSHKLNHALIIIISKSR